MSRLKKFIFTLVLSVGLFSAIFAYAQVDKSYGLDTAAENAGVKQLAISKKTVPQLLGDIVGVALGLIGIIFFILFLYAGILWMTALGNAEKANKAKDIMEAAVVGLLIVLAAYAVTRFVFTNLGAGGGGQQSGEATQTTSCQGKQPGASCGDYMVCLDVDNCVTQCVFAAMNDKAGQWVSAECMDQSQCTGQGRQTFAGYCPFGTNNLCCAVLR